MNQAERKIREREEKEALCRRQDEPELLLGGNRFLLKINHPRERRFYRLVDLEVRGERLELPGSFGGLPIREAELPPRTYPQVKTLILPGELDNLRLGNDTFPSLLRVSTADKGPYSTDGRMLYRENGTRLVYALRQAFEKRVVIPRQVKRIGRYAFVGATFEELVVENQEITVEEGAFDGSLWEERQQVVCVGSLLYRLRAPLECLELPQGVNRFMEGCFSRFAPKRLRLPFFPRVSEVFHWGRASGEIKEIEVTDGQARFSLRDVREWEGLKAIILPPSHRDYLTREGVLFSGDGKRLLFYPRQKEQASYQIGEEVEEVGEEAFEGNPYLTLLSMEKGVKRVGSRAFADCTALKECSLPEGILVLPGAGLGNVYDGGLFAGCRELLQVHLPESLEEMGEYLFRGTRVRSLSLPSSLKKVKRGALWDVTEVFCLPGTAKGLMTGLLPYGKTRAEAARVFYEGRKEGRYLLIPRSLKEKGITALEECWNGEEVSLSAYERAFEQAEEGFEKAEMGLILTLWGEEAGECPEEAGECPEEAGECPEEAGECPEEAGERNEEDAEKGKAGKAGKASGYLSYLGRQALPFGRELIEREDSLALSRLVSLSLLSSKELLSLLELANARGDTKAAAYLLAYGAPRQEGEDPFWL